MEDLDFESGLPEGFYQVFEINICWDKWAMDYCQVGAKDLTDLKEHLGKIFKNSLSRKHLNELKNDNPQDRFSRIDKIENLYTNKPYTILTSYGYEE